MPLPKAVFVFVTFAFFAKISFFFSFLFSFLSFLLLCAGHDGGVSVGDVFGYVLV